MAGEEQHASRRPAAVTSHVGPTPRLRLRRPARPLGAGGRAACASPRVLHRPPGTLAAPAPASVAHGIAGRGATAARSGAASCAPLACGSCRRPPVHGPAAPPRDGAPTSVCPFGSPPVVRSRPLAPPSRPLVPALTAPCAPPSPALVSPSSFPPPRAPLMRVPPAPPLVHGAPASCPTPWSWRLATVAAAAAAS